MRRANPAAVPSLAHTLLGAPYEPPLLPGDPDYGLHTPAPKVDGRDDGTPDAWVPRDPQLLRLTGRYPLNSEPPFPSLMDHGFITPTSIHYVRNHGAVPRLNWATHRIQVHGLVHIPLSLSMDDLTTLPEVTLPVTLVCSGNRRKEESMYKKASGSNWSACAVSTNHWTGVRLRDILLKAGIKTPDEGANYVCFRGPKHELPKGSDGSYGTSLTYYKAMDPAADILVAYKQNERWLHPDHGFPVRMIIPGFIAGRMVKWLSEITVTAEDSDNYYHIYDNRFMPAQVDDERAKAEGWWFKPELIINNLNINSAISRPWHDEVVAIARNQSYTAKGYAYAGRGLKVVKVELSLDGGQTWRLAEIRRFEKPNAYGKYWCWVHWDCELQVFELLGATELMVRAWDEDMNTQPAAITWNLMGMMNNCHYRVRIHPHRGSDGALGLRFQHPAPVEVGERGNVGWMEEENRRALAAAQGAGVAAAPAPAPAQEEGGRSWTLEEVSRHRSRDSAWFVREGKVYDATSFLNDHPGGAEAILAVAGTDATEDFNAIHSPKAKAMLQGYYIGRLAEAGEAAGPPPPPPPPDAGPGAGLAPGADRTAAPGGAAEAAAPVAPVALNPRQKVSLKLAERIEITHNTRLFRFALPSPQQRLGLPCGMHVLAYATIGGEVVVRPYTPTNSEDDLGHLDLLIKVYFAGANPKHPPGGKMSQHLERLRIGDEVAFKGPVGHFTYEGRGAYRMHERAGVATRLSMVAGGTGITPLYAIIQKVLGDPRDDTVMSLLFANVSEADILLREQLAAMAERHPHKFKVWHVLSRAPEGWQQGSGFVSVDMMRERLFPAGQDTLGLACGPPGLVDNICVPGYQAMGYKRESVELF